MKLIENRLQDVFSGWTGSYFPVLQQPFLARFSCLFVLLGLVLLNGCAQQKQLPVTAENDPASVLKNNLRINQIQLLGSHNSYKMAIDPGLLSLLKKQSPLVADSIDYSHVSLTEQLNLGLRNLEIDVFHDPDGGRYAKPFGLEIVTNPKAYDPDGLMSRPGMKVLHVQDIDFRSQCLTLKRCLTEINAWSEQHPNHIPLLITINAKDDRIDSPDFVVPLDFDFDAWDRLENELSKGLGKKIITPEEVQGDYPSLEAAVLSGGWPLVAESRGRVLILLDEADPKRSSYLQDRPRHLLFVDAPEGNPESAIRVVNNPLDKGEYIEQLVSKGYLVRTRADADTVEARRALTARRTAAFSHGAQVISTDYYYPDPRFDGGYAVSLPGGGSARCNPVLISTSCQLND